MRTAKQWSRQPWEVIQSSFLDVFKRELDKALCNLIRPLKWACFEQEAGLDGLMRALPTWIILWAYKANEPVKERLPPPCRSSCGGMHCVSYISKQIQDWAILNVSIYLKEKGCKDFWAQPNSSSRHIMSTNLVYRISSEVYWYPVKCQISVLICRHHYTKKISLILLWYYIHLPLETSNAGLLF